MQLSEGELLQRLVGDDRFAPGLGLLDFLWRDAAVQPTRPVGAGAADPV